MPDYRNPNIETSLPNVPAVSAMALNRSVFDFANPAHRTAPLVLADRIQIGVVPAGQVLVPNLTRADIPQIETGVPLSDYTIGTAAAPANLRGVSASETAQSLFGKDWAVPAVAVGHPTERTPIWLTIVTANPAGTATTGRIVFEPVTRAWRHELDG